jgi:hypothetical protein
VDVRVVGRADELRRLSGLVRDACEGRFGTVVVEGDAGIGKTTLVRAACEAAGEGALVLSGACLPLTSVAVPYLGLRSAVRGLGAEARPRVAEWGTAGTGNDEPATPVPLAVDDWLSTQCEKRPVVLVVDDLQWADQETLDVLMYLVAGPPDRALAMVMTVRTEEVGTDHRLSGWLADARRLPGVESIAVPPMTREEVADVAARELGGQPHVSLVDDLDELSGGNPYLAKLLLEGLDPSSRTIPERWPGALREAVLRSWHRLSSEARRLTVLLAVDGTTAGSADLDRLADIASVDEPARAVDEAVAAGVLELRADETYWFHHPLYAELIEQQLPPGERRELHGLFASYHEAAAGDSAPFGPPFAEQMSDRYHAAGQPAAAYRWALRAADAVGPVLQDRRRFRMLRRAAWLRLQVPEAEESQEGLWAELRSAAEAVGELDPELEAVDQLLSLMDDGREPLDRAALLARRAVLWRVTGRGSGIGDLEHAERLTAAAPQSWQRLFVLPECMAAALFVDGDTQRGERLLAEVRHLLEVYQEPVQDGDWLRARTRAQAMALLAMALTPRATGPSVLPSRRRPSTRRTRFVTPPR